MSKKAIKYPKIGQFRNAVSEIQRLVTFTGFDVNGDPEYDETIPKPTLAFHGTVKIHGSNGSFCYNSIEGFWTQSRERIITPDNDNYGFSKFCYAIEDKLQVSINELAISNNINLNNYSICVYGEWAGSSIQKGVGVSQLEKAFYIFGAKAKSIENPDEDATWLECNFKDEENRVFNINQFETYSVDVDFNMPQLSQNTLIELTNRVELECPVAKHFGIENSLGEGIVWTCNYKNKNIRFKVKGTKHSVSKTKELAPVDVEKLKSIQEFVEYSVTEGRAKQAIERVFGQAPLDRKKMGDYLRWIINDIKEEESDVLEQNGLTTKDVNKHISFKARELFFKFEKL